MFCSARIVNVRALLVLLFVLKGIEFNAQFDTQFWMPPIWDDGQATQNSPSELFITTSYPTDVAVHIQTPDGLTFVLDTTVTSGAPLIVNLTASLGQTNLPNTVMYDNGLMVNSTAPIQCVHRVSGSLNQTLVTLKGKNGLGQDFWCGSQVRNENGSYGTNEHHFISVMATQNNTQISISTPFAMWDSNGTLPNPYNFNLNAGESYLIRGNGPLEHVAGANVISDKNIVVNSGSTHTRMLGGNAADGGTDQLVPVGLMGTGYIVVKGDNADPFDYAIVVATQNATQVFIDGSATPAATLNAGEYYDFTLTGTTGAPHLITSDKTVYCYHITGASQDDEVGMSAIPQLDCTGSRYIEFSKFISNTSNQIMNVIADPDAEPTLQLNGVPYASVPGVIVNPVPGLPTYTAITFPQSALALDNIITSDGFFHAGFLTGNTGSTGTYGFLSGFDDAFEFVDPIYGLPTTVYTLDTICQGQQILHCLEVYSCAFDHNITAFSGNSGAVVVAPPVLQYAFDTCFSYTAPFNYTGGDTTTFTVSNVYGFQGQVDVVVVVQDPTTPINAGPVQELCSVTTGSLSAVNPDPLANGYWSVLQGGSILETPNSPTTNVSNLSLGTNTFLWTQDYVCGSNFSVTQIIVYDGTAPVANAGPDASLCSSNNTFNMMANDPLFTATGTWEVIQGTATVWDINDPNALITNLGIGENVFEWNINNGPCPGGATVDAMSIFVFDQNHPPANAGPDQQFCDIDFVQADMNASIPTFPATGTWQLVSGSGTINDPTNPNTFITNCGVGNNVFEWVIDNGPCGVLTDQVVISIYEKNAPQPNAGPDQQLCTPVTSTNLSANSYTVPAVGTWTVVSGSGVFSDLHDPNTLVSNLSIGDNVFQWTLDNGPCTNNGDFDQVIITVFDGSQPTANAGPDQEFCSNTFVSTNLQGSAISPPGSGLWTVVQGSGVFANATNPNTSVTGLSVGTNEFQWTVGNGPCNFPTFDTVVITIFDSNLAGLDAGPDVSFCTPTSTYVMQATAATPPSVGVWSLQSGTGTISDVNDPNAVITGLGVGLNVYRWTVTNGPCPDGTSFSEMIITIYDENAPIAVAGSDQTLCLGFSAPVDATMAASAPIPPGTGVWTILQGGGTFVDANNPNTLISNIPVGVNTYQWTLDNGACTPSVTADTVVVTVYPDAQPAANAGLDQSLCSDAASTFMTANTPIAPGTGAWTFVSGAGTIVDPNNPNTEVTGLGIGENVLEWTISNGPCVPGFTSDQVVIYVYDTTLAVANAGVDQDLCSTEITASLSANVPVFPASGAWVVVQGSGVFADASSPTTSVSGFSVGENIYAWQLDNGSCSGVTTDQVSLFVYDSTQPIAAAGGDQSICSLTPETNLSANSTTFPATGLWTLVSGSGVFTDSADPNTLVSGLSVGENVFSWTISNGPCPPPTSVDFVTILVYDGTAPAADAGVDQSYCTPISSTILQGNAPVFPASGQWTLISGSGQIVSPSSPNSQVNNLAVGENIFEWSINSGPCPNAITTDTVSIFIYDGSQVPADAGADQVLCTPSSTSNLTGSSVIFPGSGTWTVVSGSAILADPTNPTTSVSNLTVGEHVFMWTVDNGPCGPVSTDLVSIFVYDNNAANANAGPDQSLCTPTTSTTFSANSPIFPGTGTWSLLSGSGVITDPTNPNSVVSNLAVGENVFEWTLDNGPCAGGTTTNQVSIFVYSNNQLPANAGPDQSICSDQSSINLSASSVTFPATGLWSVVQGTGTFSDATSPNTSVTGLGIGENIFLWTITNDACSLPTTDTVSVFVYDSNQGAANAGPDQSICTPQSTVTMQGSSVVFPGSGLWELVSGSGVFADSTDPATSVSGLAVGENIFRWTVDNGPCNPSVSDDLVSIFVFDATQSPASAGPDQEFCTPTSTTILAGNALTFPATGVWTLISGSGSLVDPSNPSTAVTGLSVGENIFEWTVSNGPCGPATSDQVSIFIYDQNQLSANAGPDQTFCSPVSTATLAANSVIFPGTGSWSIVSGTGIVTDPSNPNSPVTNLSVGENILQWLVDNGPCGAPTTDLVSVFIYDDTASDANAGPDQFLCSTSTSTSLAANGPVAPATGSWSLISGSGSIVNPNDPTSTVVGLGIGENIFEWTLDNGGCSGGTTSDQVSIFLHFNGQTQASAGPDQDLCTPVVSTSMSANAVTYPATGVWTLISGSGTLVDPSSESTVVSNLGIGVNVFEWTVDNGPCAPGITSDQVVITVFDGGFPPPNAGADQELCAPTSTAFMTADAAIAPGVGTWSLFAGSGSITSPNDPLTEITGLGIGTNTFVWSLDYATCGSPSDTVNIVVFDSTVPPSSAGPDQEICTPTNSVLMAATPVSPPGYGTWSLILGSGTIGDVNDPSTTVNNLTVGENTLVWTVYNGSCLSYPSTVDTVSVFVFDALQTAADAGPDQSFCSPVSTATLAANSVTNPAVGTWSLVSGSGVIQDVNNPSSAVSALTVGEHVFEWSIDHGPCGSITTDLVSIFIYDGAAPNADAGPDQSLCFPQSTTLMAATPATNPAVGTWTLVSGSGNILDVNDPSSSITGLAVGDNIFQWTVDNGGCSGGTTQDLVSIFGYDVNQNPANAGPDQDLCTPTTSTLMMAEAPVFPATGTWTLISGGGSMVDPTDPNAEVTSLSTGENVFEWTVDNGPCVNPITSDQVSILVFDSNAPLPFAGMDQELCWPNTSTSLSADPAVDPGTGTWTMLAGSAVFDNVNNPTAGVSGLAMGVNTLVWTVDYGTCGMFSDTVDVAVFDNAVPPANAGPDQELCTPQSTTNLAAVPVSSPATGVWTIVSGTANILDPTDPNTAVDNLTVGEHVFVWTLDNGPCLSFPETSDTMSVWVFDALQTAADAGPDQEICTPDESVIMAANSITFPAVGTWTLISGSGVIQDVNDPNTTITGLTVGENIFEWSVDNGGCANPITSDVVSIFVYDQNQAPADAGVDQSYCTPISAINLAGNTPIFPASGQWLLLSGTGTILNPSDPNTVVTGLAVGENIFQWTVSNGPCAAPTQDVVSAFVYNEFNENANAGPDQELCTPLSTTNLQGNSPIYPATGSWTTINGTAVVTNPNDPASEVTGLIVGENTFVWTVDNGPCANGVSTDTVSVFVFDELAPLADAGVDQEFCTPTSTTVLSAATPLFPASGTWTLTSGSGTVIDPNNPNATVEGLGVGENVFTWTVYNGPCATTNSSDQVSIFIYDENQLAADAGPDMSLCTPSNTVLLSGNALTYPAAGTWTLVSGSATINDPTDPNTFVTDLLVGSNVLVWTLDNGPCPNAITTDTLIISVFDEQFPPADAGLDQEWCLPDNFATLDAADLSDPVTGVWTLVQGGGNILDPSSDVSAVVDLPVGENIFEWTTANGPCGSSSDLVSIFIYDPTAANADAGLDQFYCTPISTTFMEGNQPDDPGVGTWELIAGTGTIDNINDPNTAVSGLTIGENIFTWSIYNGPCDLPTVDTVSVFIYDENHPDAFAGDDLEICLPQNQVTLSADSPIFPAIGTWSLLSGTGTLTDPNDPNSAVTDLALGTNTFVWTLDNLPCPDGVTSDTVSVFVFSNDFAAASAGPDQSHCTPTSTVIMDALDLQDPNTGTWSVSQGSGVFGDDTDPNTLVSGLTVGINEFVWSVYNGPCEIAQSTDTVQVLIFDQNQAPADAGSDQELCLPNNTTVLNGNMPIVPASGLWELIEGSATVVSPTSPNTTVTDLGLGANTFVWSISNGPCENSFSTDTMTVFVFEEEALVADAGAGIEICTPQSCVTLAAATPSAPTTGTWTWVVGNGTISDIHDPQAEVCALGVGLHTLQWEVYNGPCQANNSFDFVNINVFDANNLPADAGDNQELCAPDNATVLSAQTPIFPAVGTWVIINGSGSIVDVNNPQSDFVDLTVGVHELTWMVYNGPCADPTVDTVLVTIFDPLSPDAFAGVDQEFCTPFGGTNLEGNTPIYPGYGNWSLISGQGDISVSSDPITAVDNLGLGENLFVWSVYNGVCPNSQTSDTVSVFVNDATIADAFAGDDQFFCGVLDSLQMEGSVTIGNTATGMWSVVAGGGTFFNLENEHSFVYDIPLGINTYSWTVDNGACGITTDLVDIIVYDPELPVAFAGADEEICKDEFQEFELFGSQVESPASGQWNIIEGPIQIDSYDVSNSIVLYLGQILDPLDEVLNTLVWTVDNGVCGTSADTVSYVLVDCLFVDVPDAFSPNADGVNDVLEIPNLFNYPNNSIKIFNRWGAIVFEASPYLENWDGRSQHRNSFGTELPVSTYYYVLDLGDGYEVLTGYIYLKR